MLDDKVPMMKPFPGRMNEHLSSCLWGFGEGSNANVVDVMENYAGSTELHTERNRKQECLHRRDEK